jgi:hypothetical protein
MPQAPSWLNNRFSPNFPPKSGLPDFQSWFPRLKEEFGGNNVMVRGAQKVGGPLMFRDIALFAYQLLK